jgi:hypothetical protein
LLHLQIPNKIISTAKTKKLNKQEVSIQKKMHLEANYNNKKGNKIGLKEQEDLVLNINSSVKIQFFSINSKSNNTMEVNKHNTRNE